MSTIIYSTQLQRYDQILITKNSKRICLENNDFVGRDLKS